MTSTHQNNHGALNVNSAVPAYFQPQLPVKNRLWPHFFMALFAAGWVATFDLGFRLYGAEVVSVVGIALVAWRSALKRHPMARQVVGAYVLWVIAILVSDIVNTTDTLDMARNMATPIVGACSLVFVLAVLSRNPNALITFLLVTVVLKAIFGDSIYGDAFAENDFSLDTLQQDTNYFKVRIDPFLTPFILLIAYWARRKSMKYAIGVLITAAVVYFFVDSRSMAAVFLLTALLLGLTLLKYRPKFTHIIRAGLVIGVVAYAAYSAYVGYTLSYNAEGHGGKQLVQLENPYNPFELLLMGRSEWLVIPSAVYERPLFGWGSWAQDTSGWFNYLRASKLGSDVEGKSIYIPVHSTIGAAWVWSGLLGLIAMLWLFKSILKMGISLPHVKSELLPIVAFFTVLVVWHFFFSPPQHVRLTFPVALASLIVLTRNEEKMNDLKKMLSGAAINQYLDGNRHR